MTAPDAHLDAEVEAVNAARAVLRSKAPHSVGTIRQACMMLQRYGDGTDWTEARHMLRALEATRVQRPPYTPAHYRLRDVLIGVLLTLSTCYVALVVMLAVPG